MRASRARDGALVTFAARSQPPPAGRAAHAAPYFAACRSTSEPSAYVCKSFKVCDANWGVADAFDMLQPLLESLHLSPANKFVEVAAAASGYVSDSCSCKSPVEVKVKIPVFQQGMVDTVASLVDDFVEKSVAPGLKELPQAGCWAENSAEFAAQSPMCVKPKAAAAPQGSICKKLTFCQDEPDLEAAKEQVTATLQPLFDLINLPAGRFLEFELMGVSCLSEGCCCSTPLEVSLRLPVLEDTAVEDVTELVDSWVAENLRDPAESNSVCVNTRAVAKFVEGATCKPRVASFATVASPGERRARRVPRACCADAAPALLRPALLRICGARAEFDGPSGAPAHRPPPCPPLARSPHPDRVLLLPPGRQLPGCSPLGLQRRLQLR